MAAQQQVGDFPFALGQAVAAEVHEGFADLPVEAGGGGSARGCRALAIEAAHQAAALVELAHQFADQRVRRAQQGQLGVAETRAATALVDAEGDLALATQVDDEMGVFHRAALEVVGAVVLAAEEVVRGDFREVVEPLGQAVLHGQAEGVEQVAPGVVALDQRLAVFRRDAALVERARCQPLALEAQQHRLDGHQAPQRLDQAFAELRFGDAGHRPRQPRMPGMQGGGGG
ncbi:hypothetical protein D9M68_704670 [compost metagenome]